MNWVTELINWIKEIKHVHQIKMCPLPCGEFDLWIGIISIQHKSSQLCLYFSFLFWFIQNPVKISYTCLWAMYFYIKHLIFKEKLVIFSIVRFFLVSSKVLNIRCSVETLRTNEKKFSVKIITELKIANFLITILQIFWDSVIQSL